TQPEPYHCGECGKSFTELPSLRRHIRSHEEGRNGPNSVNTTPNTVHQHQSDTSLPHSTQDGLSQQNAHQHEPNQSNPDPTSSCPSPDKTYCCTECGKGFKKRGHLLQHGVIHSGARPYACSTCERSFNRRESLTRHEKIHEDKPYRCPACDRCFRESTSLLNHAASGSCGKPGRGSKRPYLCTVCGRGFGRRETLRRHERVHTGEKPFHCDVCGKDFREPFHLTKHQTVHSGEKNFKCSLCGKDFGYAQSLKRHEKLHLRGDFKPRRSKTKSSANQAAAVHQDGSQTAPGSYYSYSQNKAPGSTSSTSNQPPPKLYTCDICWKSFRHHFHLTAHHQAIHEHGGEKLFSCEVCGKAFAYSNSLTRH
ncbi:zinc finger protein 865, partial [Silurus meridionalis]